ncbi:DUF2147 domain-containing protein [Maribacter sp. ANRC-HE7]|uniref:DUF2147 domain-containing protein n=1 Tax=Maribacter aquimaris TaxID=2737171 RepID=A0ABR7V9Q0_9FLAO|nr:DUF2147 domain-containing protein [Maribacter aquimaris]MBD0779976.1 DUF2147 domain-containing protein [Maribacter aquimaris]
MKYLYLLLMLTFCSITHGQSIIGQWETYDDETQAKKALIEIYEKNNLFFAKIVKSYSSEKDAVCENCKGTKKGKPINGLVIIENIKKDGDEFNSGTILDPENGKIYKCYLELVDNYKLKVRGYLGLSLFGRTQYWIRKE